MGIEKQNNMWYIDCRILIPSLFTDMYDLKQKKQENNIRREIQ